MYKILIYNILHNNMQAQFFHIKIGNATCYKSANIFNA